MEIDYHDRQISYITTVYYGARNEPYVHSGDFYEWCGGITKYSWQLIYEYRYNQAMSCKFFNYIEDTYDIKRGIVFLWK